MIAPLPSLDIICMLGILRGGYGRLWIAPPGDTRLGPHDDVMVCRPSVGPLRGEYEPLVQPVQVDIGMWFVTMLCHQ